MRLRRKDTEGTRRRAYPSDTGERKRLPPGGRAACVGQGCWEVSGDGTGIEEVNGSHTHCPAEAEPHGGGQVGELPFLSSLDRGSWTPACPLLWTGCPPLQTPTEPQNCLLVPLLNSPDHVIPSPPPQKAKDILLSKAAGTHQAPYVGEADWPNTPPKCKLLLILIKFIET